MMSHPRKWPWPYKVVSLVVIAAASVSASYGLSLVGEPQSVWLWCTLLEVCC